MHLFLLLGIISVSQGLLIDSKPQICLACCGPPPCCNDCGLSKDLLSLLKPVVGTEVEGKQVVPAKRFLDDKFPGLGQDLCLDCCGTHPCCNDCGLGDLFGHHGHLPTPGTTMEPHSPEKDETYEQSGHTGIHFPDTDLGPLHLGPDGDLGHHPSIDSGEHTGGFLPHMDLEKPYWKDLGKKKSTALYLYIFHFYY